MKPAAFPVIPPPDAAGYPYPDAGMSLRDYFAAKAMQTFSRDQNAKLSDVAYAAYVMADVMLKAREEK